jgi:hypothetical protein
MSVERIVESFRSSIVDDAVFFRPDIPRRKALGAISGYAPGVVEQDVLVLVDNTVFGGAGDGFIITPTLFAAHDMADSPVRIPISEVRDVRLDTGVFTGNKIYVNGDRLLVTLNLPGKPAIAQLVELMRAIVAAPAAQHRDPPVATPARVGATHCRSCGAPLPTAGPACIYCGTAAG